MKISSLTLVYICAFCFNGHCFGPMANPGPQHARTIFDIGPGHMVPNKIAPVMIDDFPASGQDVDLSFTAGAHSKPTLPNILKSLMPQNRARKFFGSDKNQASSSEAIGFYTRGSLKNAVALPMDGNGYMKISRSRNLHWGTVETISAIQAMGAAYGSEFPGSVIQIGNISGPKGGASGYSKSHQNGLDIDIDIIGKNENRPSPNKTGFGAGFIQGGRVKKNFDIEKNWALVKNAVLYAPTVRIFTDSAIKDLFCKVYGGDKTGRTVLLHLQHWPKHDDHFHVRLACNPSDKQCKSQGKLGSVGCKK
ncbi:penicillin-insensitive murein endopeptidase [Elusimicrobiota bacterium]